MNSEISIIIPVYNHAHTLERCLKSIAAQTYRPLEVIVVNDGSTDDIGAAIERARKNVKLDFSVINQENKGAPAARNRGLRASRGEFVIFWDADVMANSDKLQKLYDALQDSPMASYAYAQFIFGWKKIKSHAFDAELLKKTNYISTAALIRRADFPGFDESLKRFQDWDLWLTMLAKNKTGVFVPEVLHRVIVSGRAGISNWLPRFVYKLPWKIAAVKKYEAARAVIARKHNLPPV